MERRRSRCLKNPNPLKNERRNGASGAPSFDAKGAPMGAADAGQRLDEDLPDLRCKGAGDVC